MEYQNNFHYITIPGKGKKKAFAKGWEAKKTGRSQAENPYEPRIKDFLPTNPYYKMWDLGWQVSE